MEEYRIESDTMGQIQVPVDKYYGAQTARSLIHFKNRRGPLPQGDDPGLRHPEEGRHPHQPGVGNSKR